MLGNGSLGGGGAGNPQSYVPQNLQGIGNQLWQTAQDPQGALYKQQYQQTMDQANAINSMYGLGSSGAGAGMAQQAGQNFNLGWQNQQLGRQLSAAQGVAGLTSAGNGTYGNYLQGQKQQNQFYGQLGNTLGNINWGGQQQQPNMTNQTNWNGWGGSSSNPWYG